MEKVIIEIIGVAFKIFLRYWTMTGRVSEFLTSNIIDIVQYAEKCGLSYLEAKKFSRVIEDFVDTIAKDFIEEFGVQIEETERKEAILLQIKEDIHKLNLSDEELVVLSSDSNALQARIAEQSKQERASWTSIELGLYTNCVKYISRLGVKFISKLPPFSSLALKVIIQRQEEYIERIEDITADIHLIADMIKSTDLKYQEYEDAYRECVIDKYGKIELIGSKIQNRYVKRYDITSAYVELNCIDGKNKEEVKISKVFNSCNIVWIKGEAGAGKTTFLQWVAVCAARGKWGDIENIDNSIPIVIELRNIEWPFRLDNVVDKMMSYHSNGWVSELLKKQKLLLLVDGLDEISKERRNEVFNKIEDMIQKYPEIKILLTSRNSVKEKLKCKIMYYEIMPMKMDRIKNFIEYWHESVLRNDAIAEDYEIEHLQGALIRKIVENQSLKDLAKNPLLCAMLCALNYVNNEQLPDNKMQLYEQCCEMLMDARDSQRNIDTNIYDGVPRLNYSVKKRILEEMAFRMLNNGVPSESKKNIVDFLHQLLENTTIISNSKEEYSANSILDFLIERSGIIREPTEGNIDFIHKTFMEFLAVKTICRNCDWDILIKEACNEDWRETIIMCFGEMSNTTVDYVLKQLVKLGKDKKDDRYFLIASLGVANAKFFYSTVKNEIDEKIREMIPPSEEKIEQMVALGSYLLEFLKNSESYSPKERYNCLRLLFAINTRESIPIILSYINYYSDEIFIPVYQFAIDLLWQYSEHELEEYNVREYLLKNMLDYVNGDKLIICETMLYILNNCFLKIKEQKILSEIRKMIILGQNSNNAKIGGANFGKYFDNCLAVKIIGDVKSLAFLSQFANIERLEIDSNTHFVIITYELKLLRNLETVKSLYIKTNQPEIRLISRLAENMKNVERIIIYLENKDLFLEANTFSGFPNLNEIEFLVCESLARDLESKKNELNLANSNLIISRI